MRCLYTRIIAAALLASLSLSAVEGFQSSSLPPVRLAVTKYLLSSVSSNNDVTREEMIQEIEAMRQEAQQRLNYLNAQMEDMLEHQHHKEESEQQQRQQQQAESSSFLSASAFEEAEVPETATKIVDHFSQAPNFQQKKDNVAAVSVGSAPAPPTYLADSKLLHDTRWKVVIKVGSPLQNAALEGIEKALLLHLVVDFTSESLQETDDLLQGKTDAKVLRIKESWIGASSWTEGRQKEVKIKQNGGWKVLSGQGPKGIDILRFYFDVEDEISHDKERSSLRCPARRVYCTSGFFSMDHHNESEAYKDYLRGELDREIHEYEDLQFAAEQDERLFSLEGLKRSKQMLDLKSQIKATNKKITQARIRDPEKSMLRLSRRRDLGVTKEGQVCYKEPKGASSEYLVLGKMEMASIDKPIIEPAKTSQSVDSGE